MMSSVCGFRNCTACMLNAMEMPRKIVIRFASTFCAVSDSEFNHAALANQVAEHQEADERDCLRGKDARDDRDDDGEENACCFGDLLRLIRHADESLLLRCQQADDGGWTMGTSAI